MCPALTALLGVCEDYLDCRREVIRQWLCFTTVGEILFVSVGHSAQFGMQFTRFNTRNSTTLIESASAGLSSA